MNISELIALDKYFPNYDPYTQLSALEEFVNTLRERSGANTANIKINKISGAYRNNDPRYGNLYADDCTNSEYFNAFLSSSIAACLAQYIESTLRYEVYSICFQRRGKCDNNKNMRFNNLTQDEFWNISFYYDRTSKKTKQNIVLGIKQLFEAIDCTNKLPKDFEAKLKELFMYRNNVMHNGVRAIALKCHLFSRKPSPAKVDMPFKFACIENRSQPVTYAPIL